MNTNTTDLIEQFADGEPVAPDALLAALATAEGREHLRGVLELRALMADAPAPHVAMIASAASSPWLSVTRIAAAALLATVAGAGGYLAGARRDNRVADRPTIHAIEQVELSAPPAPTTVIKLDATHGWRDQSGGF